MAPADDAPLGAATAGSLRRTGCAPPKKSDSIVGYLVEGGRQFGEGELLSHQGKS